MGNFWALSSKGGVTVFLISDMCHVSCSSYPWLVHLKICRLEIIKILIMQLCLAYHIWSVFIPSRINISKMAATWNIKLNMWINIFCRTRIENSYFNFLKISVRNAVLQSCQLTCPLVQALSYANSTEIFMPSLKRRKQVSHLHKKKAKIIIIIMFRKD